MTRLPRNEAGLKQRQEQVRSRGLSEEIRTWPASPTFDPSLFPGRWYGVRLNQYAAKRPITDEMFDRVGPEIAFLTLCDLYDQCAEWLGVEWDEPSATTSIEQ